MPDPAISRDHLPRLLPGAYRGDSFVHWTMTIAGRQQGWLSPHFHSDLCEILHRAAFQYHIVIPVYCLMPDHLHFLSAGLTADADQLLWARAIRRSLNLLLAPLSLQKQGYDHVLRPAECARDAFATLVHYICANPVRAELVGYPEDWAYTGASVPVLRDLDLRHADHHASWWTYWDSLP